MSETTEISPEQQAALKREAADAAIEQIQAQLDHDSIIGVGTGSTVNCFIDALADIKGHFAAAVSSSDASTERLRDHGIAVIDLNEVNELEFYIDGADASNPYLQLIKGGGAALTREKIVAAVARKFICIVDQSKQVDILGAFPLPVEVIPMARGHVARELVALGGRPVYRENVVTDNGNHILDVHDLSIVDAPGLERTINNIAGVVTNGLFALRKADMLLVATPDGVVKLNG